MEKETLSDVIKRVQALEDELRTYKDIEQIKQLTERYQNAHNDKKPEEQLACLTEDAVLDIGDEPFQGKAEIAKVFNAHGGKGGAPPSPIRMSFFLVHPIIRVDGDKAKGSWQLYTLHCLAQTHQALFWIQSENDFEYTREEGEWKISGMKLTQRLGPAHPR